MPEFSAVLFQGERLDLFVRPAPGEARSLIRLRSGRGEVAIEGGETDDFARLTHAVPADGLVTASWDAERTDLSLAYAYDPARVGDTGLRLLWTLERNRNPGRRHRLHLQPPFGWMNDPNGLCEADGITHAFYQHYPHARRWDRMHWGHARSRNLIDWVHQPVFLHPASELLAGAGRSGGAFSGSVVPMAGGGGRVFFTDRDDDRRPNWEWQMTAVTPDFVAAGRAGPVVTQTPPIEGFGRDMRDPYVFRGPDGSWKMLLGAANAAGGLVLLYQSAAPDGADGWQFAGILHAEPATPAIPVECPCMVPLAGDGEGLHVLIFGLIGDHDRATRRRNRSFALVGRFDGQRFEPVARQELDFATDAYAFQAFVHSRHGPMGLAWAANWTDVFKDRDFESAMTFPRRLVWRDGALSTPPVDTVAELRVGELAVDPGALAQGVVLPEGLAEIELELAAPGAPFHLQLAHPTHAIAVVGTGSGLELLFEPPGNRVVPRYAAEAASLRRLRVFVDIGLIEIYADDGRRCGTKRLDSDAPVTAVRLLGDPGAVATARVHRLRPAGPPDVAPAPPPAG